MADDGYLVGFEDSNGNFVEVGRLNNTAEDVTQPFEIKHADSGNTVELGPNGFNLVNVDLDLSGNNITNVTDLTAGSVSTSQAKVTNETYIRASLSSDITNISSFVNILDTENKDRRGEFNSSNQFVPDKSGEYKISVTCRFFDGTDQEDIRIRLRDVSTGTTVAGPFDDTLPGTKGTLDITFGVDLTAGQQYEIQASTADTVSIFNNGTTCTIRKALINDE